MHFVLLINSLTSTSIQGNPLETKQLALGVEINVLVQCRRELVITTSTFCFSLCMMKERPSHLLVILQGYLNAGEVPCTSIRVVSESPSPKEHPSPLSLSQGLRDFIYGILKAAANNPVVKTKELLLAACFCSTSNRGELEERLAEGWPQCSDLPPGTYRWVPGPSRQAGL